MVGTLTIPTEPILKLSVVQYHAMIQAGILTDEDQVELINGWLMEKMPKNPRHHAVTKLVRTLLEFHLVEGYYVDYQEPITLSDSEPEPDVMIIRGSTTNYLETHP
jgi:Putative restriction endonuclease